MLNKSYLGGRYIQSIFWIGCAGTKTATDKFVVNMSFFWADKNGPGWSDEFVGLVWDGIGEALEVRISGGVLV